MRSLRPSEGNPLGGMSELRVSKVQVSFGNASRWLKLFNAAYSEKLGMSVFPGSLNIALDHVFDWFDARYEAHKIWFGREDGTGGGRDILLLPCELVSLDSRRAFLWTPTTVARDRQDPWVVETVSDVNLRNHFGLQDGDVIEIRITIKLNSGNDERNARRLRQTAARPIMQRNEDVPFLVFPSFVFALGFFVSPGVRTVLCT